MKRLEKFKLTIEHFTKAKIDLPGIRKIEALKKAIIKVKLLEQEKYADNGPIVEGLIGNQNQSDWTY